jgi:hypothetical protein
MTSARRRRGGGEIFSRRCLRCRITAAKNNNHGQAHNRHPICSWRELWRVRGRLQAGNGGARHARGRDRRGQSHDCGSMERRTAGVALRKYRLAFLYVAALVTYDEHDAAPGEWNQRPRGGAREGPARPAPAAPPRAHRGRRWGLRPGRYACRYAYRDAVYCDRR